MYTKYSKELLEPLVKESTSISEVARKLGLKPIGSTFRTIKTNINKFNIDASHFKGLGWSKDLEIKDFDGLKKPEAIKKRLIKERGYCCEQCKLSTWNDLLITLELEHVDGNYQNNIRENLLLLCPNCHSQTKTWRRRKN